MSRRDRATFAERAYLALMRLYPREFREQYGDDMLDYFRDRLRDERARGSSIARFWVRALFDLVANALHERLAPRRTRQTHPTPHGDSMLQALLHDLSFSGRMLRKNPVITAVAIVIIALGTGAVSTIFSVANAIILRPIPGVAKASDLVVVERAQRTGTISASYRYYEHLAANAKTANVAAWSALPLTVSLGNGGLAPLGDIVSGNYFDVLGVRPALGRFFSGDEVRVPDTYPVVVISYGFWQRQFAGDSGVIGRDMLVNGRKFTIVGVTPRGFSGVYPVLQTDVWAPLMMLAELRARGRLDNAGSAWLDLIARKSPNATREQVRTEMSALSKQFATSSSGEPNDWKVFDAAHVSAATGLPPDASTPVAGFFALLLAISGLVLLIASVNVASMLLARAVVRRREIAVRLALGAARSRLIRQLVTESVTLFVLGGAAGTAVAIWGTRLLERIDLPVELPLALDVSPDIRALAFTLVVAMLTGIAFGLAPALQASRLDFSSALRGDTSGSGRSRSRLRSALIIGQVALSLVLLTASGLFVRALDRGRRVDPGFDASNVAVAGLNVGTAGYDEPRGRAFYDALVARVGALPTVSHAGYARLLPLSMTNSGTDISIDGYAPPGKRSGDEFNVLLDEIDQGYFDVTRLRLVAGRGIRASDNETAPSVAVVNQSFIKRYFPTGEPLERSFHLDGKVVTIVGVVRDSKFKKLDEVAEPFMFLPFAQHWRASVNLLVRTSGDPAALGASIREAVRAIDPNLPVPNVTTLRQSTSVVLLPQRVAVAVTGVLGVLGLLLAAVGIYGVLSFSAAQRSSEIGIRIALGAVRRDVLRLVVGEGMRLVGIGMGIGLALALLATQALKPFLFGVSPFDPITLIVIAATLGGVALLASYLPARRAASADPAVSLRRS
jgi:predicted permease